MGICEYKFLCFSAHICKKIAKINTCKNEPVFWSFLGIRRRQYACVMCIVDDRVLDIMSVYHNFLSILSPMNAFVMCQRINIFSLHAGASRQP